MPALAAAACCGVAGVLVTLPGKLGSCLPETGGASASCAAAGKGDAAFAFLGAIPAAPPLLLSASCSHGSCQRCSLFAWWSAGLEAG